MCACVKTVNSTYIFSFIQYFLYVNKELEIFKNIYDVHVYIK